MVTFVRMHYRPRDLLLPPGLLSLSRIPLAVGFAWVVEQRYAALVVLGLAGLTDVLDGFIARRFGWVTPTGAAVDGLTDKLFVLTVAITLMVSGHLTPGAIALLATREIAELPLVAWVALSPRARGTKAENPTANVLGKIATVFQFVAVGWALFGGPYVMEWVWATAVVGAIAAIGYWRRAFQRSATRK